MKYKSAEIADLKAWLAVEIKRKTEGPQLERIAAEGNRAQETLNYITALEGELRDIELVYTEGYRDGLERMAELILIEHEEAKHNARSD